MEKVVPHAYPPVVTNASAMRSSGLTEMVSVVFVTQYVPLPLTLIVDARVVGTKSLEHASE